MTCGNPFQSFNAVTNLQITKVTEREDKKCHDKTWQKYRLCDLAPAFPQPPPRLTHAPPSAPLPQSFWLSFWPDTGFVPSSHRAFTHAVLIAWNTLPAPPSHTSDLAPSATSSRSWHSPSCLANSPLTSFSSLAPSCFKFTYEIAEQSSDSLTSLLPLKEVSGLCLLLLLLLNPQASPELPTCLKHPAPDGLTGASNPTKKTHEVSKQPHKCPIGNTLSFSCILISVKGPTTHPGVRGPTCLPSFCICPRPDLAYRRGPGNVG